LSKRLYNILKKQILTLRLPSGRPLIEHEVAERFGASRTPVREILTRLSHEGLVDLIPRKGTFVSTVELTSVREIFQIREALEGIATKVAVHGFIKKNWMNLNLL